ncbi:conserved hypothetical protein [Ferrimonas balearica DSM 9799]|uniref:Uncharacterized protein n=1 Tax=Ferrimonas balearica (strain DSM 9799 / CCM 4581 / KCTC 23876 / PAT) TaxID=550540 RepID=E1SNY8_FERBD|nr:hypothetical protein [Ferrimonas balearica]ADN74637.1 conserved hypothetical protein [Ferrimonas balearica DSM 9799]
MLVLAKILAAVIAVVGLAWLAERVGPRWAGVLSGFPLGTAIVLLFYALEQGPGFAAQAAPYGLLGLAATTGFALTFTLSAARFGRRSLWPVLLALAALFGLASLFQQLPPLGWWGALVALAAALLAVAITRRLPDPPFVAVRSGWGLVWARAALAAALVVAITALANTVPPAWAGVMASFPITLFPLMLLLQLSYGTAPVQTLTRHYPYGAGSLIIYTLAVGLGYPVLGIGLGTLAAFALAGVYLTGYWWLSQRGQRRLQATAQPVPDQ